MLTNNTLVIVMVIGQAMVLWVLCKLQDKNQEDNGENEK